ncbi:MAG: tRNA N6-adenosine threonylcarbamoyltransferase [Chthonomonas sp.]
MSLHPGPILGIETSCDETSAAVWADGEIRSNVVASQIALHRQWGGVVPEAAARAHVESVVLVLETALSEAGLSVGDLKGVAVTSRPGLVGALNVGVTAAKTLASLHALPICAVHHIEGHLLSAFIEHRELPLPALALVVSGGHTELVLIRAFGCYEVLGQTLDDAAGEAFDKSARLLGLGYPGGRAIQERSLGGNPERYRLPQGLEGDTRNFSFSGLKTAVLRLVDQEGEALDLADAAASVQHAIVSVLADRTARAAEDLDVRSVALVGGVAANQALRDRLAMRCDRLGLAFAAPAMEYCTDNAAMIAFAGAFRLGQGEDDGLEFDVHSNAELPSVTSPATG